MGDIADMMIDGELCQLCGQLIEGEPPGYPRTCEDCHEEDLQAGLGFRMGDDND